MPEKSRIRVVQSFRAPRTTTNPYIWMLDAALEKTPGLDHRRFSWRLALFGRYDVIHFHWPEVSLGGRTPLRRFVRDLRFQALLWRLRLTRTPVVRTIHNLELPSDVNAWERRMLADVRDRARIGIALNGHTSTSANTIVIPHGHYSDWFAKYSVENPVPGRIAFVGLIRRYKGVEGLLAAYAALRARRGDISLAIAGRPTSSEMESDVRARAAATQGVSLELGYLSEAAYASAVTHAVLVALPYRLMHNSGSVLAALSLGRPVLVPDNAVNRALSAEVGPGWVHLYSGELDDADLDQALHATSSVSAPPDLTRRGWTDTGTAHRNAYCAALARAGDG